MTSSYLYTIFQSLTEVVCVNTPLQPNLIKQINPLKNQFLLDIRPIDKSLFFPKINPNYTVLDENYIYTLDNYSQQMIQNHIYTLKNYSQQMMHAQFNRIYHVDIMIDGVKHTQIVSMNSSLTTKKSFNGVENIFLNNHGYINNHIQYINNTSMIEFPTDFNNIVIQKKQTNLNPQLELFQNTNRDKLDFIKEKSDIKIIDSYFKKLNTGLGINELKVWKINHKQ